MESSGKMCLEPVELGLAVLKNLTKPYYQHFMELRELHR